MEQAKKCEYYDGDWADLRELRAMVLRAIEQQGVKEKRCHLLLRLSLGGKWLTALMPLWVIPGAIEEFFGVGAIEIGSEEPGWETSKIEVSLSPALECQRCRRRPAGEVGTHPYWPDLTLCKRCVAALLEIQWPPYEVSPNGSYFVYENEGKWMNAQGLLREHNGKPTVAERALSITRHMPDGSVIASKVGVFSPSEPIVVFDRGEYGDQPFRPETEE